MLLLLAANAFSSWASHIFCVTHTNDNIGEYIIKLHHEIEAPTMSPYILQRIIKIIATAIVSACK